MSKLIRVSDETYDAIKDRATNNFRPLGKELECLVKNNFNEVVKASLTDDLTKIVG